MIPGLLPAPNLLGERVVRGDDLPHFRLYLGEIIGRKAFIAEEVVIEAVLDHWTDGDLSTRIQCLHRFGHHMGGVVANEFQGFRVVACEDLHGAVVVDRVREIGKLTVKPDGDGFLGE